MEITKKKLLFNSHTNKVVCGTKTCEEKYGLKTFVGKTHKDIGIFVPYTTNMNCDKWHANIDPNLLKMQYSGALSKVEELH